MSNEAGKFQLRLSEWTTPKRLFVRLMSIFGDADLAAKQLFNAYNTNVRSARVPLSPWGHLWEEAQINAPEFCQANKLIMCPDLGAFSIENEIPPRQRWAVFFSLADAYARWPSLRAAPASDPKKGLVAAPRRPRGRRPTKLLQIVQAMHNAVEQQAMTREELQTMLEKSLKTRFGASRDTCRKARNIVLSEIVENLISDNLATNDK